MHRAASSAPRRFLVSAAVSIVSMGSLTGVARAQDEEALPEVREMGFTQDVTRKDAGGSALSYFLLVGTSILAVGVMFKNSKRTHLD